MDFMVGLGDGKSLLVCTNFTGGGCRNSTGSFAGHVYHRARSKQNAASSADWLSFPRFQVVLLRSHVLGRGPTFWYGFYNIFSINMAAGKNQSNRRGKKHKNKRKQVNLFSTWWCCLARLIVPFRFWGGRYEMASKIFIVLARPVKLYKQFVF